MKKNNNDSTISRSLSTDNVPSGWRWAKMSDVADIVGGGTPRTSNPDYWNGNIPWITPADLSGYNSKKISRGSRDITEAGLKNSGARLMPAGTVLYSSRAPIGYVAIADNPVSTNQGFKSFIPKADVTPDYLYFWLKSIKDKIVSMASGTTFLEISGRKAAEIPVLIPPLETQKQIVEEIETQFTRLDAGVAALKRAQANLKRYRAAVLKAACEGKLVPTEAELAKAEGRSYETGEQLLQRILAERRAKWEEENKKKGGKKKYVEPKGPDAGKLPKLPEGWAWASMEIVCNKVQDGTHFSPKEQTSEGEYKYITAKNIKLFRLDLSVLTYVSKKIHKEICKRCNPEKGDVLLIKDGVTTGTAAINTLDEEFSLLSSVALIKPNRLGLVGEYLACWLNCPAGYKSITGKMTGTAIKRIILEKIKEASIPLPPIDEQKRIVEEVERRLSVIEEFEKILNVNEKRSGNIRNAVLNRMFTANS